MYFFGALRKVNVYISFCKKTIITNFILSNLWRDLRKKNHIFEIFHKAQLTGVNSLDSSCTVSRRLRTSADTWFWKEPITINNIVMRKQETEEKPGRGNLGYIFFWVNCYHHNHCCYIVASISPRVWNSPATLFSYAQYDVCHKRF